MATVDHITDADNFESFADNCPYSEWADGRHDGMHTALWEIRDRAEFLRILAGLERNRGAFLTELRSAQFVADGGDADLPLEAFADLMFGPGAGGVRGHYADGFVSSFAIIAPFVASLH